MCPMICSFIGAYPRSHGATLCAIKRRSVGMGLSPLARGNLKKHAL